MSKTEILKVIVGSVAHGLNDENSDTDYRGVYVLPTTEILSLGYNYKGSHWLEGESEDNTSYELGHFLHLALKCNPSILEVFKAVRVGLESPYPDLKINSFAEELQELFPCCWNAKGAYDAFLGYSLNQRKKMLDNHLNRWQKYSIAYIRTLWNLQCLLQTEDFSLEVKNPYIKEFCINIKQNKVSVGEVINEAKKLEHTCGELLPFCTHKSEPEKVNNFLLKVRREFWNGR